MAVDVVGSQYKSEGTETSNGSVGAILTAVRTVQSCSGTQVQSWKQTKELTQLKIFD